MCVRPKEIRISSVALRQRAVVTAAGPPFDFTIVPSLLHYPPAAEALSLLSGPAGRQFGRLLHKGSTPACRQTQLDVAWLHLLDPRSSTAAWAPRSSRHGCGPGPSAARSAQRLRAQPAAGHQRAGGRGQGQWRVAGPGCAAVRCRHPRALHGVVRQQQQ